MASPFRIGVCLLLGGLTTVVVAWILAIRVVVAVSPGARADTEGVYQGLDGGAWWYAVQYRPGLTVVVRERGREQAFISNGELTTAYSFPWRGRWELGGMPFVSGAALQRKNDIPTWARQPRIKPGAAPFVVTAASARGWPCRAVWYEATMTPAARVNRGGIDLPRSFRDLGPGPVLPYRIIPVGLAVDTVLYGAGWMLLLAAPGVVRRGTRRSHGLCIECGYDLRHAGHARCPECGATHDKRPDFELVLPSWPSRSTSH